MEKVTLDIGTAFFAEMLVRATKSSGEVVMVVSRPGGRILLSTKSFYPENVYRLPTGKMKKHESPEETILREIYEETGHQVSSAARLGTIDCSFASGGELVDYASHVFLTEEIAGSIVPIDTHEGLTGCMDVPPCDLRAVADQLRALAPPWDDWGRWRAVAHDFVYKTLCRQEF